MSVTTAILLAAGRGSRLSPHTDTIPKPLLPWRGKPSLHWLLQALRGTPVSKILVVTNYLEEQIVEFVQQPEYTDHADIKCVHQSSLSGTADAVLSSIEQQPDWFKNDFIVSATDYLIDNSFYAELTEFHRQHNNDISISLKALSIDTLSMRSSVRINDQWQISEVVEKPAPGTAPSRYSANLVYVLPAGIVPYLRQVEISPRGEYELQSAVNQYLQQPHTAKGLLQPTPDEWTADLAER